jgi:hypothetical protein
MGKPRHRFTADDDTAISLCRMAYKGDCRCERNGAVVCDPMIQEVEAMRPHLDAMRAAMAGRYPDADPV